MPSKTRAGTENHSCPSLSDWTAVVVSLSDWTGATIADCPTFDSFPCMTNPVHNATTTTAELPRGVGLALVNVQRIGERGPGDPTTGSAFPGSEKFDSSVQPLPVCAATVTAKDIADGARRFAMWLGAFHDAGHRSHSTRAEPMMISQNSTAPRLMMASGEMKDAVACAKLAGLSVRHPRC